MRTLLGVYRNIFNTLNESMNTTQTSGQNVMPAAQLPPSPPEPPVWSVSSIGQNETLFVESGFGFKQSSVDHFNDQYTPSSNSVNNSYGSRFSNHSNHNAYRSGASSFGVHFSEPCVQQENNTINDISDSLMLNSSTPIDPIHFTHSTDVSKFQFGEHPINQDCTPDFMIKRPNITLEYVQEVAIRYLRPPTPPPPGDLIINKMPNQLAPPEPPIIIRQQPPRPMTPEPLIIREAPPQPPPCVPVKLITISGKKLPPPPRRVIVERLAPLPPKPRSVLIERWLPYPAPKRKIVFNDLSTHEPPRQKPKNIIVQWETPKINIKREFKYLGVIRANPVEYGRRFGPSLTSASKLPSFVSAIKPPNGIVQAADVNPNEYGKELYGDLDALRLINLEQQGLGQYREYLNKSGILTNNNNYNNYNNANNVNYNTSYANSYPSPGSSSYGILHDNSVASTKFATSILVSDSESHLEKSAGAASTRAAYGGVENSENVDPSTFDNQLSRAELSDLAEQIFMFITQNKNCRIPFDDIEKILNKLNLQLGKAYSMQDARKIMNLLDCKNQGSLDIDEFKILFVNISV